MKLGRLILVIAAVVAAFAYAQKAETPKSPVMKFQGKPMPKFTMKDLKGKKITNATLKGKVVVIDFWATWCGPCKAVAPVMQKLHDRYKSKGLVVIGADVWEQGKKNTAGPYAKEHKYTYTFTENNDALAKTLKLDGIPTMLILNKKGVVSLVQVGIPNDGGVPGLEKKFDAKIKALLK